MSLRDSKDDVDGKMETTRIEEVSSDTNASDAAEVHGEEHDHKHTLWMNVKKYRKVVWVTIGLTSMTTLLSHRSISMALSLGITDRSGNSHWLRTRRYPSLTSLRCNPPLWLRLCDRGHRVRYARIPTRLRRAARRRMDPARQLARHLERRIAPRSQYDSLSFNHLANILFLTLS